MAEKDIEELARRLRGKRDQELLANLAGANLAGANLAGANLAGANLAGANLAEANLAEANLAEANLDVADLPGAALPGADLSDAHLFDVDFRRANLRQANLSGANLNLAELCSADLRSSNLSGAEIGSADLSGANLSGADLLQADLGGSNLSGAVLRTADLTDADLSRADLNETDFSEANLRAATLMSTNVRSNILEAACLANVAVDWQTVALSLRMPNLLTFLTRTGMPEVVAVYLIDSLQSIDQTDLFTMLQSVFVSYGGPDHDFADRLRNELTENGVKTWFFPKDAEFGARLHRHIQRQINSYDRMILCCSEASLQRPGVLHEIEEVLEREQAEGGAEIMIPILLSDLFSRGSSPPDWWAKRKKHIYMSISRRVAADFRGAMEDKDKWSEQLGRLLKALRKRPKEDDGS